MFKGIIEDKDYDSSTQKIQGYLDSIDDIAQAAENKYCHQLDYKYLWRLQTIGESGNLEPDMIYKTVFESIMKLVGIEPETVRRYVIKGDKQGDIK